MLRRILTIFVVPALIAPAGALAAETRARPDVLLICVDTLRPDRLSAYGYARPTSPILDDLVARGALFLEARTVEPLTGPASASMITSRFPHQHGATRNGLRMRPGLASLPGILARRGYTTGALVGNWSLRDELVGLAEHFAHYEEVFSRKRWFGLFNSEATGRDLTRAALDWIGAHRARGSGRPYFLWVHYVEPHAPYRLWEEFAPRLGVSLRGEVSKSDRYDTEIAYADHEIGRLLEGVDGGAVPPRDTLVVFVSDHGESLGDHGYWGHGAHVRENALRIPLAFVWPGVVGGARRVEEPAMIVDVAPTVLGLLGLPSGAEMVGRDWSAVLRGESGGSGRATFFQAHKGTVQLRHASRSARVDGLLEVGHVDGSRKEVLDLRDDDLLVFDLARDPTESRNLASPGAAPSPQLEAWLTSVRAGLEASSDLPPPDLDSEALDRLRALGYLD